MVFAGHNHYYARAVVNGIQHVTTGGGGAPLYDPIPSYPNIVASAKAYHFCIVEIDGGSLHYEAITPAGAILDSLTLSLPGAGIGPPGSDAPRTSLGLGPVDPNPFEVSTSIGFSVPGECHVMLDVYDVGGRRVKSLVDGSVPAGSSRSVWDGADDDGTPLPSGVYMCRLRTADRCLTGKLVLMR